MSIAVRNAEGASIEPVDNEQLEFLGDAVLDLLAAVGMWLAAPWGGVLWLLTAIAQAAVAVCLLWDPPACRHWNREPEQVGAAVGPVAASASLTMQSIGDLEFHHRYGERVEQQVPGPGQLR